MSKTLAQALNRVVYFTIKSPAAAKKLADALITSPNDSIILPFIDHPGPIAQELLSRRFNSITFCEKAESKRKLLHSYVVDNYPNKNVHIVPDDLIDLSFKHHCDIAQKRCSELVRKSLSRPTDRGTNDDNNIDKTFCDKQVKLLVPLFKSRSEAGFMRNLYYQMSLRHGLCSNTLMQCYVLMSDRQYKYLSAKPSGNLSQYRSTTILYNTIFNVQKLDSLNLLESFAIPLKKIQKTSLMNEANYRQVHIVWLKPKTERILNTEPRTLLEYRFFVNQIMAKRTISVSTFLNRWFGDCSREMKQFDITDATRSGDLDQEQYFKIFINLRSRLDYRSSIFRQAAERADENITSH